MYILLIEDSLADAALEQHAIRRTGYTGDIVWTRTGEQGLAQLESSPLPLVVLLDLNLSGMDGSVVLYRIRARERTCDLPVIVCTGSREDVPHILALGVRDYVIKTPDMYALFNVMSEILVLSGC